ncbi:MAG: transcriptional regulator, partial [Pseudomonadota bacterium]
RNGSRAIELGPRKVKPFIWWCLVDQRIAMWTMLISPLVAVFGTMLQPSYIWTCLIWVQFSRVVLCTFLYSYSRRVDLSWPFILYLNQVINASVKIFMIFHLSKQKWSNRGNQSAGGGDDWFARVQNATAKAQMILTVLAFVTGLAVYIGLLETPPFLR